MLHLVAFQESLLLFLSHLLLFKCPGTLDTDEAAMIRGGTSQAARGRREVTLRVGVPGSLEKKF